MALIKNFIKDINFTENVGANYNNLDIGGYYVVDFLCNYSQSTPPTITGADIIVPLVNTHSASPDWRAYLGVIKITSSTVTIQNAATGNYCRYIKVS